MRLLGGSIMMKFKSLAGGRFWLFLLGLLLGGFGQCFAFFLIFFDLNVVLGLQQHILASFLLSFSYKNIFFHGGQKEGLRVIVFLFVFFIFLPVVGFCGLFIIFFLLSYATKKDEIVSDDVVVEPPSVPEKINFFSQQSEMFDADSINSKKCLLMSIATSRMETRESVALIRKELSHTDDEVRLLASLLITRKAKKFNDRISMNLKNIMTVEDKNKTHFYECLAYDYWELVYLGLVQGGVADRLLKESRKYAVLATKNVSHREQAALYLLLARISLRMEQKSVAINCLHLAEKMGVSKDELSPYWQEVYFL